MRKGTLDGDERTAFVVGAGGLGLFLQWLLQNTAARSTLITRRPSWERFQKSPLRLSGAMEGTQYLKCHTWESVPKLDPLATVFVATRAREVPAVLETLRPRLSKNATVVLCQDGIGVFAAANAVLPKTRLVRLACWLRLERWELDHVRVGGLYKLELAGDPGDAVLLEHWRDLLSRPGLQTTVATEPGVLEWKKALAGVATDALAAVAEVTNGALLDSPELKGLANALIAEAATIAALDGIRLTSHDRAAAFRALEATRGATSPALEDLRAGRPPETDLFGGAVVKAAARLGTRAPLQEALLALVAHKERSGRFAKQGSG